MAYNTKDYVGDVNLEYGGVYFDLSNWEYGYVDALEVSDLSDCGVEGGVEIRELVIEIDNPEHYAEVFKSCGLSLNDLPEDEHTKQLMITEALYRYGWYYILEDHLGLHTEIVQCDEEQWTTEVNGHQIGTFLSDTGCDTLEEYVQAEYDFVKLEGD